MTNKLWGANYFEVIDLITAELKRRFEQIGMKLAAKREQVLIQATLIERKSITTNESELNDLKELQLPITIDLLHLNTELVSLYDACKNAKKSLKRVKDIATVLAEMTPNTRQAFKTTENLIALCLCLPVSVAGSERTFPKLRRLKHGLEAK